MKAFVTKAEALQNNRESVKRFQTSQSLSYAPLANLTFKGVLGVDYRLNTNKNIINLDISTCSRTTFNNFSY